MERMDYFSTIPTVEDDVKINVSASDTFMEEKVHCLIQVSHEGRFATAYLTDQNINSLIFALRGYLQCTHKPER